MCEKKADKLFAQKWPTLVRVVEFYCGARLRLARDDPDAQDLLQIAALELWRRCSKPGARPDSISCQWVLRGAVSRWRQARDRNPAARPRGGDDDQLADIPARPAMPEFKTEGVLVSRVDVEIDHPELIELWHHGIPTSEVAGRLGVARQTVERRAAELGGVRMDGRWRFPPEVGQR